VGYLAKQLTSVAPPQGRERPIVVSTVHAVESVYEQEKLAIGYSTQEHIDRLKKLEMESRYADVIVAPSPAVKQEILRVMADGGIDCSPITHKIHVVPSGIHEESLMPVAEVNAKLANIPETLNIITLSRIDPSKGIEFGIKGVAEFVKRTGTRVGLAVVGRVSVEKYLHELQELARRFEDFNTRFYTNVPEDKKLALLDRAHVYLLPTLQDTFGITIIEGAARGNIVISTDAEGPLYVIRSPAPRKEHHWGYVTEYGVAAKRTSHAAKYLPYNLAHALKWVVDNWHSRREATIAFQQRIREEYTWDAIAKMYIELYHR
jgi:glycosyltransferase involved in cell wall biosynthesis